MYVMNAETISKSISLSVLAFGKGFLLLSLLRIHNPVKYLSTVDSPAKHIRAAHSPSPSLTLRDLASLGSVIPIPLA